MIFIDTSVFLHAFLKPRGSMPEHIPEIKGEAKKILGRVDEGEKVLTSVTHLSEVSNILETRATYSYCRDILSALLNNKNIEVLDVTRDTYNSAIPVSEILNLSINDCLAYNMMKRHSINGIYSFDKHFDNLPDITRITQ